MSPAAPRRYRVSGKDFEPIEMVVFAVNERAAVAKAAAMYELDGLAGTVGDVSCGIDWHAELIGPEVRS